MPAVSSGHTGLNSQLCLFFFFFLAPAHSLQGLSPNKGWTLGPLQWEGGVPTTRPPGNSLSYLSIKNPKMFCVSTFQILKRWFSSVQSVVLTFATPWTAAHQASLLSIPNSWSLFKLMTIDWVGDAIEPSHPLSSTSSPTFSLSQHQGLFKQVSSSHEMAKVSELQLQHQSFQSIFRTDFL